MRGRLFKIGSTLLGVLLVWQICLGVLPVGALADDEGIDASAPEVVEPGSPESSNEPVEEDAVPAPVPEPTQAETAAPVESAASVAAPEISDEPVAAPDPEEERAARIAQAQAADEAAGAGVVFVAGEILVVFADGVSSADAMGLVNGLEQVEVPASGIDTSRPAVIVNVAETASVADAIEVLQADPRVVYAQPNYLYCSLGDGIVNGTVERLGAQDRWYQDGPVPVEAESLAGALDLGADEHVATLYSRFAPADESLDSRASTFHDAVTDVYADRAYEVVSVDGTPVDLIAVNVFYRNASGAAVTDSATLAAAYRWMIDSGASLNIRVANLDLVGLGRSLDGSLPEDRILRDAVGKANASGILTTYPAAGIGVFADLVDDTDGVHALEGVVEEPAAEVETAAEGEEVVEEGATAEEDELEFALEEEELIVQAVDGDETELTAAASTNVFATVDAPLMTASGDYTVTVSNIYCPAGVSRVRLLTWSRDDLLDVTWNTATPNGDGTYSCTISAADHLSHAGTYTTQAYVVDRNGNTTFVGEVQLSVSIPGQSQPDPPAGSTMMCISVNSAQTSATVTIRTSNATAVSLPVWSVDKGQDDLVWYKPTKVSSDTWKVTIPLSKHKSTGTLNVHCYTTVGGKQSLGCSGTFSIDAPTATARITNVNKAQGTYTVKVSGVDAPAGVAKVQMPTWVRSDQKDIKWYTLTRASDGTYTYTVPMSDHSWTAGTYHSHVYVTDNNGATTRVGVVDQEMVVPPADISISLNSNQTQATVIVKAPAASAVTLPIWSENKGQDDLVWYNATKQSDGTWKVTVPLNRHKSTGVFNVHAYVTMNGTRVLGGHTTFTVAEPTATVQVTQTNADKGTYTVRVSGISSPAGVAKVQMPTWVRSDQKDIKWYTLTRAADGTYTYTVPMSDHSWIEGTYHTHVYVTDNNGATTRVGVVDQEMTLPAMEATVTLNASQTQATVVVKAPQASAMRIPVWSVDKGQDDLVWYNGVKQSDGTWKVTVPLNKHKSTGTFNVHCYANLNGTQVLADSTTFEVTPPSATVEVRKVDENAGTYTLKITGITCPSGVAKVQVPTWVRADQKDIKWYTPTKHTDGTYSCTVEVSNHAFASGTYQSHVYITDGNGAMTNVGIVNQQMTVPAPDVTAQLAADEMTAQLTAVVPGATAVEIAVWSEAKNSSGNAQDDLVWYKATKQSDGTWKVDVPISAHKSSGRYQVHCYATINGKRQIADATTFTVTPPTATLTVTPNDNYSQVTLTASNIVCPSGIVKIQVPVWSSYNGQDDIIWYTLAPSGNGTYSATVDVGRHYFRDGQYNFHCYVTAGNGIYAGTAAFTKDMRPQLRAIVMMLSDTQMFSFECRQSRHFTDALADIQLHSGASAIVINGDMVDNSTQAEYDYFKGIINRSGISYNKFSFNLGNHEMRAPYTGESYGVLWTRFRNNFNLPRNYYTKQVGGQRFIFCGCDVEPESGWVASRFSDAQINWLEQQLSANDAAGVTSYVCIHHPIINTVPGSKAGQWGSRWGNGLENGQVVKNVLDRHPNTIVFTSHTHWDLSVSNTYRESENKPLYVNTAAIANTTQRGDVEAAQGWYLFIFDDRVELRGRDFHKNTWVDEATYTFYR